MRRWGLAAMACAWMFMSTIAFGGVAREPTSGEGPATSDIDTSDDATSDDGRSSSEVVTLLRQAESMLAQGRAGEAFDLLAAQELELAGTPTYDYLLGLAALDSKRLHEATFALERVVLSQPDFPGARMELARARFESGEDALARTQFQYLLSQSPPEQTRNVIRRYLDAIAQRSGLANSRWSALAQLGAGYDSNANGSTSEQSFLGFTLDRHNVETESSFGELTLGGGNTLPFGQSSRLVSSAQLTHRANTDASFIDQTIATLGTSLVWARGNYRFSGGVEGYGARLDGESHERGVNLNAGVSRRFGDYEGALSLRAGTLEYEQPALRILDAKRYLTGVSVTRPSSFGTHPARLGAALLLGMDDAERTGSPYGNDRVGVRFFGSLALRPQLTMHAELSGMDTRYDGDFFGSRRKDEQLALTLALDLQDFPASKWSVAPRVRYLKNDSNISLYEYDRLEAVVYIRRGF